MSPYTWSLGGAGSLPRGWWVGLLQYSAIHCYVHLRHWYCWRSRCPGSLSVCLWLRGWGVIVASNTLSRHKKIVDLCICAFSSFSFPGTVFFFLSLFCSYRCSSRWYIVFFYLSQSFYFISPVLFCLSVLYCNNWYNTKDTFSLHFFQLQAAGGLCAARPSCDTLPHNAKPKTFT